MQMFNIFFVCFPESQATMSSMGATDSVFASKESGVTAVAEQKVENESAILEVNFLKVSVRLASYVECLSTIPIIGIEVRLYICVFFIPVGGPS